MDGGELLKQYGPWIFVLVNVVLIWRVAVGAKARAVDADTNMQNTVTEAFTREADERRKLQKRVDDQDQEIAEAKGTAAQNKSQIERLSGALESANRLNAENSATIERLQQQQQTDVGEIAKLRETNANQEQRLRAVEQERDTYRDGDQKKADTIRQLEQRVADLTKDLEETQRQLESVARRTPTAPLSPSVLPPDDKPKESLS